jgi:hypothetical protein
MDYRRRFDLRAFIVAMEQLGSTRIMKELNYWYLKVERMDARTFVAEATAELLLASERQSIDAGEALDKAFTVLKVAPNVSGLQVVEFTQVASGASRAPKWPPIRDGDVDIWILPAVSDTASNN